MGYVGQAPGSGGVTSSDIVDLAIVNADVNASAAIAMSKTALVGGTGLTLSTNTLAVDASQTQITAVGDLGTGSITSGFTSIDVGAGAISTTGAVATGTLTVTGNEIIVNGYGLVVGHTAQLSEANLVSEMQVVGVGNDDTSILLALAHTSNTRAGTLAFSKTASGTHGTYSTAVVDTEFLGQMVFSGSDGTDGDTEAAIHRVVVDDASPEAGGIGTAFVWLTSPGGGTGAAAENMRLSAAGDLTIGLGNKLGFDQAIGDTYIYQESADDLHIVVGGVIMAQFDQDLDSVVIGTAAPAATRLFKVSKTYADVDNVNMASFNLSHSDSGTTAGVAVGVRQSVNISAGNYTDVDLGASAVFVTAEHAGSGTVAHVAGHVVEALHGGTGTTTDLAAYDIRSISGWGNYNASGTVTNAYGFRVPATPLATGTVTNAYGLYVANITTATNNYGIYLAGGAIGVAGSAGTDGQVLTSGGANANAAWEDAGGGATFLSKAADQTSNNTTTYQDDTDLQFAVLANREYAVWGMFHVVTNYSANFKTTWTLPSGATREGLIWGSQRILARWHADPVTAPYTGEQTISFQKIITIGGTSGTAVLQWAQLNAHASDTGLEKGSWMAYQLLD